MRQQRACAYNEPENWPKSVYAQEKTAKSCQCPYPTGMFRQTVIDRRQRVIR